MSTGPETPLTPGNWAVLAALTFGSTLLFIFIVVWGIAADREHFIRFKAPGVIDLDLPAAGRYVLYCEYTLTPDSQGHMRPGIIDQIVPNMQAVPDGDRVEMEPADKNGQYKLQRTIGEPINEFVLPRGGTWRLTTELAIDADGETANLAIIPNPAGRAMRAFFAGFVFQMLALLGITALAYAMRWRNMRAQGAPQG
ncbi:MAG: hypothetical protein GC168_02250 [Candidatus Hydrogenedens sp.]|nr:hypothetical protein [Candidatus Hydrogenedens sp.]